MSGRDGHHARDGRNHDGYSSLATESRHEDFCGDKRERAERVQIGVTMGSSFLMSVGSSRAGCIESLWPNRREDWTQHDAAQMHESHLHSSLSFFERGKTISGRDLRF